MATQNKNSSGDEIANVNFYAVRPEATRIRTAHERYRRQTDDRRTGDNGNVSSRSLKTSTAPKQSVFKRTNETEEPLKAWSIRR